MDINALLDNCTLEDLGRNNLKMYQLKEGFRFGMDSVLLSWFAASFVRENSKKHKVLELGAGCGACSLLLSGRRENTLIDSVELMDTSCAVLNENIKLNGLENRMRAFCSDIRSLDDEVRNIQYDIVMANPPFFSRKNGPATTKDKSVERLNGRFEENGTLDDFVKVAASRVLPSSGYVLMIMKGDRLIDLIRAYELNKITPTHLLSIHPFSDSKASSILLCGKRGVRCNELKILPPLILNERDLDGNIKSTLKTQEIYEDEHKTCFI